MVDNAAFSLFYIIVVLLDITFVVFLALITFAVLIVLRLRNTITGVRLLFWLFLFFSIVSNPLFEL